MKQLAEEDNSTVITTTFRVSGVDCDDEVKAISKSFENLGIEDVDVNIVASTVTVRHSKDVNKSKLIKAVEVTGVKIVADETGNFFDKNRTRILFIACSGITLALGLIFAWGEPATNLIQICFFGVSTLAGGALVFPKAYRALKQKSLDMNVLMGVAVVGAFVIHEYSEAATVVFLFSLSELLESFSVDRARQAIKEVLRIVPQVAHKKTTEAIIDVKIEDVKPKDKILIKPGERVALDGIVIEGITTVNEAPVTGESTPVEKGPGSKVFAGTINEGGLIVIEASGLFQDTKIAKMMKLIEEAQSQKAPSEQFVNRFAKIYTPAVFCLAILIAFGPPLIFSQNIEIWAYRALVLLVVACPCALVLATPISVVSGLAALAKRGILVKGGVHLESLGKLKVLALDKTGTLTEGKFAVQSFRCWGSSEPTKVLSIATTLEQSSNHPLARAIVDYVSRKNVSFQNVTDFKVIAGRGAEGTISSHRYFVGNHRYTHELGVCSQELEDYLISLEQNAQSVVIVGHSPHDGHSGEVLGIFGLGDSIRPGAKDVITSLEKMGLQKVVVLSGDNQKAVETICNIAGISEGYGDLLPEDKVRKIKELTDQYRVVGMVGDGINDSPALAQATIGISMGAGGTDAAIETSDVTLMRDNLSEIPVAVSQGRRVLSIIHFNIFFALSTKIIFLVLAVLGFSSLWLAVAADMGASLFVTVNALRLLKTRQ